MNFYLYVAFNLTIFIAGVLALVRFRNVATVYYPFLYCLWIGCINELISLFLVLNHHPSLVNNNLYVFAESLLIAWFFKRLGLFQQKWVFPFLLVFLACFWVIETFVFRTLSQNSTCFRIVYSLLIVFISINIINQILFSAKRRIYKDATFLLCTSFAIYFTYKALLQTFVLYGVSQSTGFLLEIYVILIYINLAVNLLYAQAVLWMPTKIKSIRSLSLLVL